MKSFAAYRLRGSATVYELLPKGALVTLLERAALVSTSPVTAASRKRLALWNALNAFGIQAGVVRFWGTHPPERIKGFMLSHYFHLLRKDGAGADTLHPPDLLAEVQARAVAPEDVDASMLGEFVDLSAPDTAAGALAPRARGARPRPRPHLPARGPGPARRLRPAVLRHLLLRARRRGPRLHALRRPRALRRRPPARSGGATAAWSTATPPSSRGRSAELVAGPAPGRDPAGGLRLRHAAGPAVAAGLGGAHRRSAG